jgi:hypothetical protein
MKLIGCLISNEKNEIIKKLKFFHGVNKTKMIDMIIDDYLASHPEYEKKFEEWESLKQTQGRRT